MSGYKIAHLEIDSPFGNAGGVVKDLGDVEAMAKTGVGWIEAGSYTLDSKDGNGVNGEVVYHHDPETGATYNSLGMPNKGMDVVEKEIPEMAQIAAAHGKPLVVNVAPISHDPVSESLELVTRAYEAGADGVLLNAGCPNVITEDGGRHEILSHNPEALSMVLYGLREVTQRFKPVFIRTSPQFDFDATATVMEEVHMSSAVSAVFTPNTIPNQKPVDKNGDPILQVTGNIGGLSGPIITPEAIKQTIWARSALMAARMLEGSQNIDVVCSGGITDGRSLRQAIRTGRAAAGAGTTLFYESQDWKHDVDRLLREYVEIA